VKRIEAAAKPPAGKTTISSKLTQHPGKVNPCCFSSIIPLRGNGMFEMANESFARSLKG